MSSGSLYQRLLGHPFVYNHVRPRVVGGIDMWPLYERLGGERHTIVDVGCGMGDALNYLGDFEAYTGFDTDPIAIDFARTKYAQKPRVRFECGLLTPRHVEELAPTAGIVAGVLHHLNDADGVELLRTLQASPRLRTIVTQDIVYVPGKTVNNVFAFFDRGRFCRHAEGYEALARKAGLRIEHADAVPAHPKNRRIVYFLMTLTPSGA